jgi:hypothetical protein
MHVCRPSSGKKIDIPKRKGESDADYYQRMDILHWGHVHKDITDDKEDTE